MGQKTISFIRKCISKRFPVTIDDIQWNGKCLFVDVSSDISNYRYDIGDVLTGDIEHFIHSYFQVRLVEVFVQYRTTVKFSTNKIQHIKVNLDI
jgi:hypothetical protein